MSETLNQCTPKDVDHYTQPFRLNYSQQIKQHMEFPLSCWIPVLNNHFPTIQPCSVCKVFIKSIFNCQLGVTFARRVTAHNMYCKTYFFACPLFREFREPDKFTKIMGRENLNTVPFQCSEKQKRQNYVVQNN